jgi:hypothetical protein
MASIVRSYNTDTNVPIVVHVPIGDSQTINIGDLIQIDGTSRKGVVAVAASTTLVGVAQEAITTGTATDADVIPVVLVRGQVVRLAVDQTGSKKTFAATDKYTTLFDLKDKVSVNPDDTTNGMCCVQDYDNTQHTVDVIFAAASLANVG